MLDDRKVGMYNVPVVNLTIEGMRHNILMAISEHTVEMQEAVEAAVDEAVKSFDFGFEVQRAARLAIKNAIEREVDRFFSVGPGGDTIRKAIERQVEDQGSWSV